MKVLVKIFLLALLPVFTLAQKSDIFRFDSLPEKGISLSQGWKFHAGDNPEFAKTDFDDSAWEKADPSQDVLDFSPLWKTDIGWFRFKFSVDSSLVEKSIALLVSQTGASEIYLNGQLIGSFGKISTQNNQTIAVMPTTGSFIGLPIRKKGEQVLSVRFAVQKNLHYINVLGRKNVTLELTAMETPFIGPSIMNDIVVYFEFTRVGIFLILSILTLALFLFNRSQKANLSFFLFTFAGFVSLFLLGLVYRHVDSASTRMAFYSVFIFLFYLSYLFYFIALYQIFNRKRSWIFWIIAVLTVCGIFLSLTNSKNIVIIFLRDYFFIFFFAEIIRIVFIGKRQKVIGANIIFTGVIIYQVFNALAYLIPWGNVYAGPNYLYGHIVFNIFLVALPVAIAIFLALESSFASRSLKLKLEENEKLSKEKQQILSTQNETLEKQVAERTAELQHKNRDLEIEAALERVRSKTMAMQKSSEITDVADVLYTELQKIGFNYGACTILIMDKISGDAEHWVAGFDQKKYPKSYYVPYFQHACLDAQLTAWKNGKKYLVYHLFGEEKKSYDAELFSQTSFKNFPENGKIMMQQLESATFSLAFMAHGALHWGPSALSEEQAQILQRFANVFEQSYTRFLDLQKAEAQVREAEIELALERVRSRTMAMQHSDELAEAANLLFQQVHALGIPAWSCGFNIWEKNEKSCTGWMSSYGVLQPPFKIPLTESPSFIRQYESKQNGEIFYVEEVSGEALADHYRYMGSLLDFSEILKDHTKKGHVLPTFQINHGVNFKHGTLVFITSEPVPEAWDIFIRLAKVFEQTYIRFLDLQKAEAQAREAQIEVALERVRNRTMAMQHSDELAEAANLLSMEVRSLGIPIWSCGYNIFEDDEQSCRGWMSTEGSIQPSFKIPLKVSPTFIKFKDSRREGVSFYEEKIDGVDLQTHYTYMLTLPEFAASRKAFLDAGHQLPESQVNTVVNFKQGNLIFISADSIPEAHTIFKRFTKIFEQTYTRFLDLKKAEAQAREAQLEATFERIRSRAMAMDTSDELNALIGFIYKECFRLDMNLNRSLLMTFDKNTNDSRWWIGAPEDSDLPMSCFVHYHEYAPSLAILKGWLDREQKWTYLLEGENKKSWDEYAFTQTGLVELPEPVKTGMRSYESILLNASFQNFGCVMLASYEPLNDEHFDLLARLSKVFDLAYTRYLDLQLKEENALKLLHEKQKLEKTLSELKATQNQLIQSEKLASLGELTAGIAHEIQNPLNFVNNFADFSVGIAKDLIEEMNKPNIDKEYIAELLKDLTGNQEKINHHGKRAASIVTGMLEHSRTSKGVKGSTDINKLCDEYFRLAFHGLRAKDKNFNCDMITHFDASIPNIEIVGPDVGRVILNLINNAFYAVNERNNLLGAKILLGLDEPQYKPTVTVTTQKTDNTIEIRVKDNGTGIPEAVKEKIFQPFFTTKPTGSGTGLGLSLSYDIITKGHGGSLIVESVEGMGSEFIIILLLT